MTTNYEIWLTDENGLRLALLDNFIHLECSKVVNAIGNFILQLPLSFNRNLIRLDNMIQVWRRPIGGSLTLWNVYFLRRWIFEIVDGRNVLTIAGPDVNDLLRRRIVAAYSGSTQATGTGFAGNIMNDIVSNAIIDSVAPTPTFGTRVWSDFTIQNDIDTGTSITRSFSFDKLLDISGGGILNKLADASFTAGEELYFEVAIDNVTSTTISFQFRTYNNQPRQDVTDIVVFSDENNNLENPSLEYDYTEEENYVYGLGQGEGIDRDVAQAGNFNAYSASRWNRCEGVLDDRAQSSAGADSAINERKGRIRFSGRPLDTISTRFGVDWDWGYRVTAKFMNFEAEYNIGAVTITVNEDGESIDARMDDTLIPVEEQQ